MIAGMTAGTIMKRFLILALASASVTACATTSNGGAPGMASTAFDHVRTGEARRAGAGFGYELESHGLWQAAMNFESTGGEPLIEFAYAPQGGMTTVGELEISMPYLADGVRRFHGATPDGRSIQVELQAGPCSESGSDEAFAYFARVRIDGSQVSGCAAEVASMDRWSNYLSDYMRAIDVCLAEFGRRGDHVSMAYPLGEGTGVRIVDNDGQSWECATRRNDEAINSLRPLDAADVVLGEGDPIFVRNRMPPSDEGCYVYESVRESDGRLIGALGFDVCDAGPSQPVG